MKSASRNYSSGSANHQLLYEGKPSSTARLLFARYRVPLQLQQLFFRTPKLPKDRKPLPAWMVDTYCEKFFQALPECSGNHLVLPVGYPNCPKNRMSLSVRVRLTPSVPLKSLRCPSIEIARPSTPVATKLTPSAQNYPLALTTSFQPSPAKLLECESRRVGRSSTGRLNRSAQGANLVPTEPTENVFLIETFLSPKALA